MVSYKNVDWKQSPAHVDLLARFKNPYSKKKILQFLYLSQNLKEEIEDAIQRFIDTGMITTPTLSKAISGLYNRSPIEELLRKHNLKISGDKVQLIERLIQYAPETAQRMVIEHDLLVCSDEGLAFLEKYETKRRLAEKTAKEQTFHVLLTGNSLEAYKVYISYQDIYANPVYANPEGHRRGNYDYLGKELEIILTHEPKLLRHLDSNDRNHVRAATCMPIIWRDETAFKWLSNDFIIRNKNNEVICDHLANYARIQHEINGADQDDKFKISFTAYDVDSCDLCRRLDGKLLALSQIPELPDINCSSKKGCQCRLERQWLGYDDTWDDNKDQEGIWHDSESFTNISVDIGKLIDTANIEEIISEKIEEFIKEKVEIHLDPLSRLRTLKRMLDEKLIKMEEYESTKQRILSKF